MGGKQRTFAGLAGMGDLIVTCSSSKSRNHHVGFELGQGKKLDQIISEMNEVAEGVKTAKVVLELAKEYNVDMPISNEVYKVLYEGNTVLDAFIRFAYTRSRLRKRTGLIFKICTYYNIFTR